MGGNKILQFYAWTESLELTYCESILSVWFMKKIRSVILKKKRQKMRTSNFSKLRGNEPAYSLNITRAPKIDLLLEIFY